MKLLRTFHLSLNGSPAQIEALISHTSYEILDATSAGRPVDLSLEELERFEQHVDSQIKTTETEAYCFESGRMERFQIVSHQGSVLAVIDTGSCSLPRHTPQFTEAAEAFALDQEYADQVRFGLAEPDDDDHSEYEDEHSDFCPRCHAECQADHTNDCPYFFEEQPRPF